MQLLFWSMLAGEQINADVRLHESDLIMSQQTSQILNVCLWGIEYASRPRHQKYGMSEFLLFLRPSICSSALTNRQCPHTCDERLEKKKKKKPQQKKKRSWHVLYKNSKISVGRRMCGTRRGTGGSRMRCPAGTAVDGSRMMCPAGTRADGGRRTCTAETGLLWD